MSFVSLRKPLTGFLSAALIVFHLPAQATEGELIARIHAGSSGQAPFQVAKETKASTDSKDSKQTGRNLAVVEFANDTGEKRFDNLKRGLAEMLSSKLAKRPEMHLVERSQLDKAIKELGFGQSAYADSSKVAKLGKMAGASVIITGSLVKGGSHFEINLRMLDVATGTVLLSENYGFQSEDDILPVANYLSLLVPQRLGLYVSDAELEIARTQLKGGVAAIAADNSWIYWTIGAGVVVVGALVVGGVMIARANAAANAGPDVVINRPVVAPKTVTKAQFDEPLMFNLQLGSF